MNKPDLNEILNNKIGDLVDLLHTGLKTLADEYDLNTDQLSEMERDFIARLAFAAIKYGVNKEEKEDCENCPANDHCSFKEPEKESEKPEKILQDICNDHSTCIGCMFARDDLTCRLANKPYRWEV